MRLLSLFLLLGSTLTATRASEDDKSKSPPPFFLQDPTDSLCLTGEEFKRCSIDTLFYVVGAPGKYQIHKRAADGTIDQEDDGTCITKKSCKEGDISRLMEAKLAKCSHCGAKNWNILGDADTGYVLTEGEGKTCLIREKGGKKAFTAPCDSQDHPYTPLQLQFASAADIKTMNSPGARMIGAASDGDKKAIQALLKEGIDVNVRDWDDLTALIPAASSGHLDICKLLIKEKIDVNAKDKDGITALMEASIMGHIKIVEYLLDNGAEVDAAASSEVTALWLAASEGRADVIKTLIKKGAEAKNTRVDGITALMTASVGGHAEAIKLLLENGADPTATDKDGLTCLMNAAENGTVAAIKALAEHVDDAQFLDSVSNTGYNALTIAAAHGHADAIAYLIEAGANVGAVDDNGVTALMYAAASNKVDAMKVLIEKGKADIDFRHSHGGTALLEASTGGATDAIKLLLESGAKFDFVDNDGVSPLMAVASQGSLDGQTAILESLKKVKSDDELKEHINMFSYSGGSSVMFAAAGGHYNCTKQLIELGADVNAIARATPDYLEKLAKMVEEGQVTDDEPNVDGVTAMHVAAQGGHKAVVDLLIESGADVTVLDDEKRSALLLAVKGNYGEVASSLVKAGADPNTEYVDDEGKSHNLLFDAIMVENDDFAVMLVEKGANLGHTDEKKVTTLLQAAHRGLSNITEKLLEKNSKPEYVDAASEDGITPLIAACSEGHPEVVKQLIAAKVNANAVDKDGTTALMAAAARGHHNIVSDLLAAKVDVNAQNVDGHTALMFAYNGKNQVETLWERYNQFVAEAKAEKKTGDEKVDDGGTGPVISEALENHKTLIDQLLKAGADPNLKDKEGHAASDFDFHPDADSEVLDKEAKAEKVRDQSKYEL
ncbi:ankyrin 3, node of Ranvier (ankyrin G) [Seminavis robusta]|uniref:Ankyrin 3, node of Ranvier (Ankyrin G) n=1 Tax=Seminavis robusta TaxID=568900 RepID=A0A9N8EKK4_9STRA|nr:ankyrin 3, node of Ranvier (ankyrin G) [Seminavis robusta]|eukprot:Sro1419_g271070.1 ankyrin 3, node of Ranvier (ankyrin G) (893) ;mRNA; f:7472-10254